MIDWDEATSEVLELAGKIAKRVGKEVAEIQEEEGKTIPFDEGATAMNIVAVHISGCRLDLLGLLEARSFDLFHDVFGIGVHLNKETGQLENCFLPRYAEKEAS